MQRAIGLFAASLVLCVGGCDSKVMEPASDGGEGVVEADGGGNFPEPVQSECGTLPDGVQAVPELSSAYAVIDSDDPEGDVRIRFGTLEFGCDEPLFEEEGCVDNDGWAFAVSLPPEMAQKGIQRMADVPEPDWEVVIWETYPEDGCGGGVGGGSMGPEPGLEGEIEIFSRNERCVVGEMRGFDTGFDVPAIDVNGGFVAKVCHTDCVPVLEGCRN